jgi:lipopolysaccharide transport system ATP-binding protein
MPHLIRGKYSMNIAFAEGVGDDHVQHHWIHDAIQLDVIRSRVAHGYSGMNDLTMNIEILRANGG